MRSLSSLALAALSGASVVSRYIFRVTLPGGVFGASDGPDFFTWDNGSGPVDYYPLDAAAKVTLPPLQGALRTDSAVLGLSITDPVLLTDLLAGGYRAAPAEIAALLFENGVPGEEFLKFDGICDQATIDDTPFKPPAAGIKLEDPSISTLTMTLAPLTVDLERSRGRFATDTDQRVFRDANDSFFQDVALVGVSTINWGQAGSSSPAASAFNRSPEGAPSGLPGLAGGGGGRISNPVNFI